jgi:glyoxylase-like metal-dependent hydrolase (beta-lactamase superfamily II)
MAQPLEGVIPAQTMALSEPWIDHFFVGPLQMRCSVVTDRASGDTIIIDGGDEPQRIIDWVDGYGGAGPNWTTGPESKAMAKEQGMLPRRVVALVNTHAHFDHSGFIPTLRAHYDVDWFLHPDDDYLQTLSQASARRYGLSLPEPAVADQAFEAGEQYSFGSIELRVLHTPGHTLGGCCLLLSVNDGPDHVFVGDTLFAGSVGRTDIANSGGDFDLLANSIHTQLWPLDDATVVHPGHGPLTTIGHEKRTNPFVGDPAGKGGTFGFGKYA